MSALCVSWLIFFACFYDLRLAREGDFLKCFGLVIANLVPSSFFVFKMEGGEITPRIVSTDFVMTFSEVISDISSNWQPCFFFCLSETVVQTKRTFTF